MKKIQVIRILDLLPEEFEMENFIEKLLFLEKVEVGIIAAKQGKTVTLEEAKLKFLIKQTS